MSKLPAALRLKEEDVKLLLAAQSHIGSKNAQVSMSRYVHKVREDGVSIINLGKTWEKLVLAARIIAAIENPQDIVVISARNYGQRAVLKFASHTGSTAIAGRFTPGTFTNYITRAFREPRLIIVTDPLTDHQAILESSYVNVPVIAFADVDCPLKNVDVAIPINNKSKHSVGLAWWLLSREVLRLRGTISRDQPWEVMVDMFFYRDPEEVEKENEEAEESKAEGTDQIDYSIDVTGDAAAGGINPGLAAQVSNVSGGNWEGDWSGDVAATQDWAEPAAGGDSNWE